MTRRERDAALHTTAGINAALQSDHSCKNESFCNARSKKSTEEQIFCKSSSHRQDVHLEGQDCEDHFHTPGTAIHEVTVEEEPGTGFWRRGERKPCPFLKFADGFMEAGQPHTTCYVLLLGGYLLRRNLMTGTEHQHPKTIARHGTDCRAMGSPPSSACDRNQTSCEGKLLE